MSGIENWLPGLAPGTGGSTLPAVMAAGALAALVVAVVVMVLGSSRKLAPTPVIWGGVLSVVAGLLAWAVIDGLAGRDHAAARRALDTRASELTARTLVPGSPLACLDSVANATVEAACERLLFASPEGTAAALAYVDARIALLADGLALAANDPAYAESFERLRRTIEADRFGLVAHVLATRGCAASQCPAFKLLRDPRRVATNLRERAFDANVALYAGAWRSDGPALAAAPQPAPMAPSQTSALAVPAQTPGPALAGVPATSGTASGIPLSPKYDFPSAASIPPVSIMNSEPPPPPEPPAARAAAAPAQAAPQRRAAPREPAPASAAVPLPVPAPAQGSQSPR